MKINKIEEVVGEKLVDGTLPDIDTDFEGKSRSKIKSYMEERFGVDQVCSVGSFTTIKIKGAIKDIDRQLDNNFQLTNFITSMISEKILTMKDLFELSCKERKLKEFIKTQSDIFYFLPTILNQPKAQSIHPCAMIIFPDVMSGKEWCPVRMQQGLIVSEWDGYQMDNAGFLKEDILGIKQLDKFADILRLIEKNGKEVPDIYNLPSKDKEVFRYFSNGWNGDIFQFGSPGLTSYTKSMKPQDIEDLIAANALYRPGPMENHYHEIYIKCKNEGREPKFLWGTEEITKDTYGLVVYQEQVMEVCQKLGGLSMKEADDVRRAMGKKNVDILREWKERVGEGFKEKGCPPEEFEHIWDVLLEFAKYSFNRSHSAAYAQTGYIGMYLKVHYPLEYWTVALDYANEEQTLMFLSEMLSTKEVSVVPPDVNGSDIVMRSDMETKKIYWGIESIKGIGEDTAIQIVKERKANGKYLSLEDFISRHDFKGSKVKKQTYEALITCGAFDEVENIETFAERKSLIEKFREIKNVKVSNPARDIYTTGKLYEDWWWLLKQKELTGFAEIDYKTIAEENGVYTQFATPNEFSTNQEFGIFRGFGGYIVDIKIARIKTGKYARMTIEHNYKLFKVLIWPEQFEKFEHQLVDSEKSFIVFDGEFNYDDKYSKSNQITIKVNSSLSVLR